MHSAEHDIYLVTGASSGLGRAIALKINELGGRVIAVARDVERLRQTKLASKYSENLITVTRDLSSNMDDLPSWVLGIAKEHGKLKGMVLSAGIQQTIPLQAFSVEEAKTLFDINYFANIALTRGFCDKRSNIGVGSSVIFLSSISSIRGVKGLLNYGASKGAVNSAVKAIALEVAKQGIRINSLLVGYVATEMLNELWSNYEGKKEEIEDQYPLGLGKTEDVANYVCFLLSDKARWITGSNVVMDGGASI